ncbi:MAG: hypothetical protein QXI02_03020 [Candidatus Caldarchaeum sp.]
MRRRVVRYKEAFLNGLRAFAGEPNQDRLARCYNAYPRADGLYGWSEIPQVVEQHEVDFPFPQMFVTKDRLFLFFRDGARQYIPGSGWESFVFRDVYTGQISFPYGTDVWHFVDLTPAFIATNGSVVLFRQMLKDGPQYALATSPNFNTLCHWRGRVFSGGVSGGDLNTVYWSSVGEADFSFRWFLFPEEKEREVYKVERGEFGAMRMPFSGEVLVLKPHRLGVVAYGQNGIALLFHSREPVSTFGLRELEHFGIPSRGAVAGSEDVHVFVSSSGDLMMLDGDARIKSLGYREFFEPMLTETLVVSYLPDPVEPKFFISSEKRSFVFTPSGLGEIFQCVTSAGFLSGEARVVSKNLPDRGMLVELSEFGGQFEEVGLKQVDALRLVGRTTYNLFGFSKVRYESLDPLIETRPRQFSPTGFLRLGDTGTTFRICIGAQDPRGVRLHTLDVEFLFLSKQLVRGAFGPEVGTEPSESSVGQP